MSALVLVRGPNKYEFAAIVDALGWLKSLCMVDCRRVDAHQKRELEHAERTLMQALHFTKRVRDFHLCNLETFADARRFNVDAAWCDHYDYNYKGRDSMEEGEAAVECIRYLFE